MPLDPNAPAFDPVKAKAERELEGTATSVAETALAGQGRGRRKSRKSRKSRKTRSRRYRRGGGNCGM
jgi:hypothetical protein